MAAFKDVVGDYLTNKGGFDEKGVKKTPLVLNKGITVAVMAMATLLTLD